MLRSIRYQKAANNCRNSAAFEEKGDEAELDAIGKIYYRRDQLLKQAEKVEGSESGIAAIRQAADQQAAVLYKKAQDEFDKHEEKQSAKRSKGNARAHAAFERQTKAWEEGFNFTGTNQGYRGPG